MSDNDQRSNLKKDKWIIIAALAAALSLMLTDFGDSQGKVYDCRDAHWHPDVPIEVKRECSRIMHEHLKKQIEEESKKRVIRT